MILSCLFTLSAKGVNLSLSTGLFSVNFGISKNFGPWQAGGIIGSAVPQFMIIDLKDGKASDKAFLEAFAAGTSISLYADRSVISQGSQRLSAGTKLSLLVCPVGLPSGTADTFAVSTISITAKWETGCGKKGGFFAETSIPFLMWAFATDFMEKTQTSSLIPLLLTDPDNTMEYIKLALILTTRIGYTWHL